METWGTSDTIWPPRSRRRKRRPARLALDMAAIGMCSCVVFLFVSGIFLFVCLLVIVITNFIGPTQKREKIKPEIKL